MYAEYRWYFKFKDRFNETIKFKRDELKNLYIINYILILLLNIIIIKLNIIFIIKIIINLKL